jgi:hypothetical protein
LLQTAEYLQAAAHFNNTVQFVIEKYGPLSKKRTTGELCVLKKWRGFDEAENTEDPLYDKCIDTSRLLKDHLLLLAETWGRAGHQGPRQNQGKGKQPGRRSPGTTGDTDPNSYVYGAPRVIYLSYLYLLNLCFAMGRCCV